MEENLSGIEEVETLRNNLRDEIGNRVRESEILTKASFFHPTYSLLYKQCNEENFDALKDLLRREMQDIAPSVSAPESMGDKTMKHQEMNSTDISSVFNARISKSILWIGGGDFVTAKWNRLTDEGVSDLVFSNNALKTLQKASKK
ncbi:hypothetical protein BGZ97_008924 [Linnemannia gamsii]|uniref:Uncharacterized protein n=1 Tax=Linnemannia gamsii TaxID=64522 RepID=A0A9P6QPB5_9FUNG|nr:hypothetical protein BGZ97_008924 [Linnemannia gamsii]